MTIIYSRFRILLFTFTLGVSMISIYARLTGYLDEVPVQVPQVESETPIIIRLCPESSWRKFYRENGYIYFSKEKAVNCSVTAGGGG